MSDEEAVILKSPEPFESRYAGGCFMLALLIIIPFAIFGLGHLLFDPESFMGTAFMFIGAGVFLVMAILYRMNHRAAINHFAEMRNMKFKLTNDATLEKIYNKIEPALRSIYGEKVKFLRKDDCVVVTFNGIDYKIVLNDDATFSIHLQKSLLEKSIYIFAKVVEIFYDRDYNDDAVPTWNYEKIRTGTPIIAYELQRAFGVTSTSENKIQPPVRQSIQEIYERAKLSANATTTESKPSAGQSIQEIYERAKLSAKQTNIAENSRQNIPAANSRPSRNKKVFIVPFILIAVAGLFLILSASGVPTPKTVDQFVEQYNSTPKTLDQFVEQYNSEIKRTTKDSTLENLVKDCTLDKNNFSWNDLGKTQTFFYDNIFFAGWDSSVDRMSDNPGIRPVSASFTFYYDPPASVVFAVIRAAISAAGGDEEKVTQALGITRENDYTVPYNFRREITFNDKEYSIISSEGEIVFSVQIHNK